MLKTDNLTLTSYHTLLPYSLLSIPTPPPIYCSSQSILSNPFYTYEPLATHREA
jgi:hypothetical protein